MANAENQRRLARGAAMCLAMAVALHSAAIARADWPHWRGPSRNDIAREPSGYRGGDWLPKEPAWRKSYGAGSTSPIVAGGGLYTFGWRGGVDRVSCVDAASGEELWRTSYKAPKYGRHSVGDQSFYEGPSATPEFDPQSGLLYTLGIDGDLHCWDTRRDGKKVWGFNLYDRFGADRRPGVGRRKNQRDYGYTCAPLVHGDALVVEVGGREGAVMAFSKRTGERLWASQSQDRAGHSGGLAPIEVEGVACAAVLTLTNLLVVRLDAGHEGETVAEYPWATDYANNIPTPAVYENFVLVTSAYDHMAMCKLKITLSGAEKVWERPYPSGVCSPVIRDGAIYWAWKGMHCLDFASGEEKWSGGGIGTPGSCIATSDDRLIVWTNRGDLLLVESAKRSPNAYRELASKKKIFRRDAWPHVVLSGGRIYCKDRDGNLACFELAGGKK